MDKDKEAIARRLESAPWRTTQRENRLDFEQHATAGKWSAIASAIINYQNKNKGQSPPDHVIARDTCLSVGQVSYHMGEMEKAGLIRDVGGYPRVILVQDVAKVKALTGYGNTPAPRSQLETQLASTGSNGGGFRGFRPGHRRIGHRPFKERAVQLAQLIDQHWREHGVPPSGTWLMAKAFPNAKGKSTGSVKRVISQMREKGWVLHEDYRADYRLTPEGRVALLGESNSAHHVVPEVEVVDTEELKEMKRDSGPTGRKGFLARAKEVAQAIIDHYDLHGYAPTGAYLKERVYGRNHEGGGLARVTKKMVQLGWLYHKPGKHHDYAVTGLGRAALFGEVREQLHTDTPVNPVEPEPIVKPQETITGSFTVPDTPIIREAVTAMQPAYVERTPSRLEPPKAQNPVYLSHVSDVDLVIELTGRGFKVHR